METGVRWELAKFGRDRRQIFPLNLQNDFRLPVSTIEGLNVSALIK